MSDTAAMPSLDPVAEIAADVGEAIAVGDTGRGVRRLVPMLGGRVTGRLSGVILPGGADHQMLGGDGLSELDARYVVRTDAGAMVYVVNRRIRCGPVEAMDQLARGEPVDPALVCFRTAPCFETADPAHRWLPRSLVVATGIRQPAEVIPTVFEVTSVPENADVTRGGTNDEA